jgi:uncharacterized Zn-finger protein
MYENYTRTYSGSNCNLQPTQSQPENQGIQTPAVPFQTPLTCPQCNCSLSTLSGYNYHIYKPTAQYRYKAICEMPRPAQGWEVECDNCLQGFTRRDHLSRHAKEGVCKRGEE